MGMLIHHTWQAQQNAMKKEPEVKEEIPFTEPEEEMPVEEPGKDTTVRKTSATRRRKTVK